MEKEIEVPCRVCGAESEEVQLCSDHLDNYNAERARLRSDMKEAEEAMYHAAGKLSMFTPDKYAERVKLTDECGRIRHGKYTSTMCGKTITEESFRMTPSRRYFVCEDGHVLVAVFHCNEWTMIEQDRDHCTNCNTEFNTSGQELRPENEWEEDRDDY